MKDEHSFPIEHSQLIAVAKRNDRAWGHAIDVSIVDAGGSVRGKMTFACHPEFREFEAFQAMGTEALIEIVRQRVAVALSEIGPPFEEGIVTLYRFNSPNDKSDLHDRQLSGKLLCPLTALASVCTSNLVRRGCAFQGCVAWRRSRAHLRQIQAWALRPRIMSLHRTIQ